jgi:hypothetical protein
MAIQSQYFSTDTKFAEIYKELIDDDLQTRLNDRFDDYIYYDGGNDNIRANKIAKVRCHMYDIFNDVMKDCIIDDVKYIVTTEAGQQINIYQFIAYTLIDNRVELYRRQLIHDRKQDIRDLKIVIGIVSIATTCYYLFRKRR